MRQSDAIDAMSRLALDTRRGSECQRTSLARAAAAVPKAGATTQTIIVGTWDVVDAGTPRIAEGVEAVRGSRSSAFSAGIAA